VSAGAKKRNTLDATNTYNEKSALSKSIYMHRTLKADSNIACRANAALKSFPCHAVPLSV